jgi:PAS domain S-box-containing protein/putative nucleotidyltransferase with HDIG domain
MDEQYAYNALNRLKFRLEQTIGWKHDAGESRQTMQTIANELRELLDRVECREREWSAAFDAVQDPIFFHDQDYRIIRANTAYARLVGMDIHDIIGKPYWQVFPKGEGLIPECVGPSEQHYDAQCAEVTLDSGQTYLTRGFAVNDVQGEYQYSVHIMEDVTEQRRLDRDLEESTWRYQNLFESAPDAILLADAETGMLLDANPAAERLTGRSHEDILSLHQSQLHPADASATTEFKDHVRVGLANAMHPASEMPILHVDGHEIMTEVTAQVFWLDGKPVMQGIFRDITARKAIEARLRDHAQILDQIHDAVISTDLDGIISSWNQGAERLLGYTEAEALGKPITFLYPEEEHSFVAERVIAPLKAKGAHEIDVRIRHKSGEVFYAQLSLSLLHDEQGISVGMIGYALDITQRKLAEHALHDSEETFRTISNTAQDAVLLLDDEGKIVYWNPAAERIFGYESQNAIGQDMHLLLVPKQYREAWQTAWPHFQNTGEGPFMGKILELSSLRRDGSEFPVELSVSSVKIRGRWHAVGVLRDITKRKQAEKSLRETSNKLSLSLNLLKGIIESIPVRVFWTDRDLRYLGCNTLFARDAGLSSPDELIGKTNFDMGWTDQAEHYRQDDRRIMESGIPKLGYEERQTTPDGQTLWMRTSKVPLHNDAHEVIGILGIYDDITAQKQAEQNLQLSESRLKEAQEVAHLGSWEFDLVKNDLWLSDENLRIFGLNPAEQNTYETFLNTVHPDDREHVNLAYTESVENKTPYNLEHRLLMSDGSIKWVQERCKTHYADDGTPLRSSGTTLDITERKCAEAQASRLGHIIDSSINEIYVFDAVTLNFLLVNEGAQRNLGYSMAEMSQLTPLDLKPEFTAEAFETLIDTLRHDENKVEVFETLHRRRDGSLYPVEVHLEHSAEEIPPVFCASILDITTRHKTDERLRHSESSLAEAQRIAQLGNWEFDITANHSSWSDEMYRIFEIDPRQYDVSYEAFLHAIHPDDLEQVDRAYRASVETKRPFDVTHRLLMSDGRIKYVREMGGTHYSEDGRPLRSLGTAQDITEQYLTEQALNHSNHALKAISSCNSVLVHATSEDDLLNNMCHVIVDEGGYLFAWIGMVEEGEKKRVLPVAHAGFEDGYLEQLNITYENNVRGRGPVGCAVRHGEPQVVYDTLIDPHFAPWRESAVKHGFRSTLVLPMKDNNGKVFAVLSIYAEEPDAFDEEALKLMQDLANDLGFGILALHTQGERDHYLKEHLKSDERYKKMLVDTIRAMSLTVEKRDPYTAGHQNKVAQLSVAIGRELGMDENHLEGLRLGATIHDIGKIYVPAEILNRPGRLSKAEFEIIKSHAEVGYDIIKDVHFPWPVANMVVQHHERMDGSGYPRGLRGEEIILEARILAVADVVEAITSHRPYRPAVGLDKALMEVEGNRGALYDTEVANACLRLIRDEGFTFDEVIAT